MDEILQEICDNYCKYPCEWDEDEQGQTLVDAICVNCPLNKLEEIANGSN